MQEANQTEINQAQTFHCPLSEAMKNLSGTKRTENYPHKTKPPQRTNKLSRLKFN